MRGKGTVLAAALLATAAVLAGCKESEQDRVLYHQKGVYQGPKDQPLDPGTVKELRSRALRQGGETEL